MITLEKYKEQIDTYFDNTPPSEIIKRFEALGYEFEPIDNSVDSNNLPIAEINQEVICVEEIGIFDMQDEFSESLYESEFPPVSGVYFSNVILFQKTLSHNVLDSSDISFEDFDVSEEFNFFSQKVETCNKDYEQLENTQRAMAA